MFHRSETQHENHGHLESPTDSSILSEYFKAYLPKPPQPAQPIAECLGPALPVADDDLHRVSTDAAALEFPPRPLVRALGHNSSPILTSGLPGQATQEGAFMPGSNLHRSYVRLFNELPELVATVLRVLNVEVPQGAGWSSFPPILPLRQMTVARSLRACSAPWTPASPLCVTTSG